jgi:hypothetical protein
MNYFFKKFKILFLTTIVNREIVTIVPGNRAMNSARWPCMAANKFCIASNIICISLFMYFYLKRFLFYL